MIRTKMDKLQEKKDLRMSEFDKKNYSVQRQAFKTQRDPLHFECKHLESAYQRFHQQLHDSKLVTD